MPQPTEYCSVPRQSSYALSVLKFSGHWSASWGASVSQLWFIVLALQIGLWLSRAAAIYDRDLLPKRTGINIVMAALLTRFVQAVIWIVVVLAVLENAGVNITTLVASLGIGGVALALATQSILGDLIAAILIALDKPFQVGDFIVVGDISGNVESIGFKSTHIRSAGGEQIVCSNTDLLKRSIQNFKRMKQRQINFRFNLSYHTSPELAERVPAMVKEIISAQPETEFLRAHLVKLGVAAIEFEAAYTVLDADFNRYMDIQQNINLNILRHLAATGIDLALPDGNRATHAGESPMQESSPLERPSRHISH